MPARPAPVQDPAIALVGVGCRYPGGVVDLASFWQVLEDGVDVIGEIPADRWGPEYVSEDGAAPGTGYCRWAGTLPDLPGFDADFFGISFREAREMDPQQRLLLEVSWEALEHAGLTKPGLAGSRTGVFFGMLGMDYSLLHAKTRGVAAIDPYFASGKEFSFAPGRLAYTLGLHGPALSVNTACSSSLVAVHLACRSLASGESDTALAGGVNVLAAPELSVFMSKVQALSPTGRCRPFSAEADGIVRGEGCGVVVLKRLDDALADGDRVLGVIRASAMNHDGRSAGLTVPNALAQVALLREALHRADDADPRRVRYVETHGTGTPLGDPIEAHALAEVFGPGREPGSPLYIGSHKANFGHTDAAAGVAALIKTVLTARHGLVPPQLHLGTPTPAIPWEGGPLRVSAEAVRLPVTEDTLLGVSAFGLSGTNAHVLLAAPPEPAPADPADDDRAPGQAARPDRQVLLVSAPTEESLRTRAEDLRAALDTPRPAADLLHTAAVRRTHHEARAVVTGADAHELRASLRSLAQGEADSRTVTGTAEPRRRHQTVFVFSGQGSQWRGMGLDLWDREPAAAASLHRSDEAVRAAGLPGLRELLGQGDLAATELAQPAVVAVQLALAEVWRARGLEPHKVLGHSLGEISAACWTGALDLPTALDLAVRRGRIMARAAGTGRMLAVPLPEATLRELLAAGGPGTDGVTVAAVNGPAATVLAGPAAELEALAARLAAGTDTGTKVTSRHVPGDYAFHSPAMAPFAEELRAELTGPAGLAPRPTPAAFRSTVFPDRAPEFLDAGYWAANLLRPVLFWPAVNEILDRGGADFVEIGPHPTLVRPLTDGLRARRRHGVAVGSLRREADGPAALLDSLAQLHCAGADVRWADLTPGRLTDLPRHPWQHEQFWLPEVTPGQQYAPGAGPVPAPAAPAPAGLSVQLLDAAGQPLGPARTLDLTPDAAPTPADRPAPQTAPPALPSPAEPTPVSAADSGAGTAPTTAPAPEQTAPEQSTAPLDAGPAGAPDRLRRTLLRRVSRVLGDVLGQDPDRRIPPRRGFADIGLDSLSIVDFVDDLGLELGLEIPAAAPFEHPCLEELTDYLLPLVAAAAGPAADEAPEPDPAPEPAPAQPQALPAAAPAAPVPAAAAPAPQDDPVAVVGMSCRFPGSPSVRDYWQLLLDGREAIRDVPPDRWDGNAFLSEGAWTPGTMSSLRGGYLDDVRGFDAAFFRVSPREARSLDPQHRLFLEVAYEALEDAGADRERLRGSATGVYVGMNSSDHAQRVSSRLQDVDLYYGTGNSFAGAPGRLSYFLGLTGPSMAVDTACSSSLSAVHLACQSLLSGESDLAVAGGVNVILSPVIPVSVSAGGALSPSGRCRTFDDAADGYLRGEGCGALVLKRLSAARADGDRVYAVLPASVVNQDGASSGLTVPNGTAQRNLVRAALDRAGLTGAEVGYVEAHGTGTPLGDPIELRALSHALRHRAAPGTAPLLVGSVKPNIGHLEGAAGVAGLIKAVLAVHHGRIPAHIGVSTPTRQVPWAELGVEIAADAPAWPGTGRRVAGVSSFGFTGTNAHVLVAEAPPAPAAADRAAEPAAAPARFAVPLSAAQGPALRAGARDLLDVLDASARRAPDPAAALADLAHTAATRRTHLEHRAVATGQDLETVRAALEALAGGAEHPALATAVADRTRSAVFVYSGFGSQWVGMGRRLLEREPVFRAAAQECEEEMRRWTDWSPLASLRGDTGSRPFDEGIPQELVFLVQVALTALWRSWGVTPAAVVGHSMGEVAAAWASGALTLAQAAEVLCLRSRLLDGLVGTGGGSLAVGLSRAELAPYLVLYDDRLGIATVNGPRTTVVSGDLTALAELAEELTEANVFVRTIKVPVAPHSPLVEPLRGPLEAGLAHLVPAEGRIPFHSAVTGGELAGSLLTAAYWGRNLRDTVLFQDAVCSVEDPQDQVFLEISPHPVLVSGAEQSLAAAGVERPVVLPSLVREEDEVDTLLATLGALHANGVPVDWARFTGSGRRVVDLPRYPWQRKEHWLPDLPDLPAGAAPAAGTGALLGAPVRTPGSPGTTLLPVTVDGTRSPWQVSGPAVSAAALLEAALEAAAATGSPVPALADVRFGTPPRTDADGRATLQAVVDVRAQQITLRPVGEGPGADPALRAGTAPTAPAPGVAPGAAAVLDEELRTDLAGEFPALEIRSAATGADGAAEVALTLPAGAARRRLPADLLRLALRLVAAGAPAGPGARTADRPAALAAVRVRAAADGTVLLRRGPVRLTEDGSAEADLTVLDPAGRAVVELTGTRLAPPATAPDQTPDDAAARLPGLLYRMTWAPEQHDAAQLPAATTTRRWLVCGDTAHLAGTVAAGLAEAGHEVVRVRSQSAPADPGADALVVDPADPAAWPQLLAGQGDLAATAVVDLWPLEDLEASEDGWPATTALTAALAGIKEAPPRLWVVTRNALVPPGHFGFPQGAQGGHAALGRNLAMVRPEAWGGHVDLAGGTAEELRALVGRLLRAPGEEHALLTHATVHVAALTPYTPPDPVRRPALRADGWFLVTGAGRELAPPAVDWLVAAGARRIALVRTESAPADGPAAQRLEAWRAAGAEIRTEDAPDTAAVTALAARLRADGGLAGVVCAGAPGTAVGPADTRAAHVRQELARARTAQALHDATLADPLELFVLLGTVAGGGAASGAAAPADGLLRALAARRAGAGLPVAHMNLMPLETSALLDNRTTMLLEGSGITPLREADLTAALDLLVPVGAVQVTVADMDWQLFGAALADSPHRRLFAPVLGAVKESAGAGFTAQLGDLDPVERHDRMLDWVCAQVTAVLGMSEDDLRPDQGFFELGMDSVMSLALRLRLSRDLSVELAATVAFENPTAQALTRHLLERLGHPVAPAAGAAPAAGPGAPAPAPATGSDGAHDPHDPDASGDLDDLDDDELLRQLEAEIAGPQALGLEEN
ncbi:beta-ketoacyl synthase N-terminal-like domain-containing protein [Streptomyces sp. NPDC089919]|uniref:type I polyketide synthase n=1 Tax=Streptomyces sp. NPDC089919 TaxID=3155188 RepID=UPI00343C6B42